MNRAPMLMLPLTFLAGLLAAPSEAATRCVSPTVASCHDTIQAAVGLSSPGDTVYVYEGTYNEEITVAVPNLTIRGRRPGSKWPITSLPQFKGIETDLRKLGLQGHRYLATCPKSVVEVCETPNAPTGCGSHAASSADGFAISAPGVTIQDLTIRHARNGVRIDGVTDTTVRGVCLQGSGALGIDATAGSDRTLVDGTAADRNGVKIVGDDSTIRYSIGTNMDDPVFTVIGDNYVVERNASAVTDSRCIRVDDGPAELGGRITRNVGVACNGAGVQASGRNAEIGWNLTFLDTGVTGEWTLEDSRIHDNIMTDGAARAKLTGDDNELSNNVFRRVGGLAQFPDGSGLWVVGDRNEVRNNVFEQNPGRGVLVEGSDNELTGNRSTKNDLAGIGLRDGADNSVDRNVVTDNRGEGVATLADDTDVTHNVLVRNRTDFCMGASVGAFAGNTVGDGSGPGTICVVEE